MKLKRLISCGLVGILTGVGILMNAKVSSAEDKSVTFNADCLDGFKNSYAVYNDNKTGFLFEVDKGYKNNGVQLNKGKGAGTLLNKKSFGDIKKIDINVSSNKPFDIYIAEDGDYSNTLSYTKFDSSTTSKTIDLSNEEANIGFFKIQVSGCVVITKIDITYSEASITTKYPVTFYDGEAELTDLACKVEENGKITKPADPVKEGYVFDAWYKESTFDNKWDFENDIVAADTKLYAKFLPEAEVTKYTVTFKSDENTVINTVTVKEGNSVGEPENPVKDGYQFDGWYTDVNCTDKYDFNTVVSADLTLYAKWLAKYTVSFDTDGGSTVESQTVVTGNKATKPAVNPTKKGYNFVGWYTDNTYTTEFDFENTIITDNTTIYAKFEDTSIIRLNGYTFNKISTLEGLTTGYYVIGGYISNSNEYKYMISDMNTTKSFKSSDNPTEFYEIKLKGNSVTIKNSKNMYIISNTEKSVSLSEKEKTIFTPVVNADGFKLKVTGSLNFQFNPSAKIFTSYTSKQQDLTLFKAQNVKPFYVTFKGPNNEELNKEEMLPHQKAPEFEAPNKPGHKFMGWYNEATDAKYDFTTELSEETVLVAKYEALTPAELFEQLEIKNQLAYHWQTEDGTTYKIDNVSLRFGVNLTEEMKSLEGVKFGAILAKKEDVANINLSEYARECISAAEVVAGNPNLKYLEFTNIAAEGGMTSLRLDNLDSALAEEFVVVIYMEYNGKLYVTEQKIASVKVIASEYLKSDLEILKNEQIKGSLNQLSK